MPSSSFKLHLTRLVLACTAVLAAAAYAAPPEPSAPASRPSQASLLIQSSPLAGSQYHALPDVVDRIHVGDSLTLRREPDNPHDRNAIQVLWQGHLLGFVPRRENKAVARAMDQGNLLIARVVALRPAETPWQRLRFEISMPLDISSDAENRMSNQAASQQTGRSEPMLRSSPSNPVSY